jgi:hypothetical protein
MADTKSVSQTVSNYFYINNSKYNYGCHEICVSDSAK